MQLVLEQTFPLGRFHATPWKVFPYDDPHGEWPPSPWRLVRAVLARSYQLDREVADSTEAHAKLRSELVHAFATSQIEWHLPPSSWRGPGLRQYQPVEFDWGYGQPSKKTLITLSEDLTASLGGAYGLQEKGEPDSVEVFDPALRSVGFRRVTPEQLDNLKKLVEAQKKPNAPKPRKLKRYPPDARSYGTSKVLDNFWVTANGTTAPVLWHFDGPDWTPPLLAHLDACLARMTYFGRAESITEIRRTEVAPSPSEPVKLSPRRSGNAVPVLALQQDATLAQLEATTDAPSVKDTNIPPGSRWMYAERPQRPTIRPMRKPEKQRPPVQWMQFALGSRIPIYEKSAVTLTQRFRGAAAACLLHALTDGKFDKWHKAPREVQELGATLTGKDADGSPLIGHRHAVFFLHFEGTEATRLCAWSADGFNHDEQIAMLRASEREVILTYKKSSWTAKLIPLDGLVPPPPGIPQTETQCWKSMTPYVPPRHVFDRRGNVKRGESVAEQIAGELADREFPTAEVEIEESSSRWVKVHQPSRASDGATNDDKRGYTVRLTFSELIEGPVFLGHSCHFGLGLFVPSDRELASV